MELETLMNGNECIQHNIIWNQDKDDTLNTDILGNVLQVSVQK